MAQRVQEIRLGTPEYQATLRLRAEVLLDPFGIPHEAAMSDDAVATHLALFSGEECLGCLMLVPQTEGVVRMRQIAVMPRRQREGLGRHLMHAAEESARARGFHSMIAAAREPAVPFYLALGYSLVGAPFVQVGLPHHGVEKLL